MRALLIDNYDSYTYNLYQLIAEVNGEEPRTSHRLGPVGSRSVLDRFSIAFFSPPTHALSYARTHSLVYNQPVVILNDEVTMEELDGIMERERVECIVVSPGPGTPASSRDAGASLHVFSRYTDVPIFGVCFGFQCLCQVSSYWELWREAVSHSSVAVDSVHDDRDDAFSTS